MKRNLLKFFEEYAFDVQKPERGYIVSYKLEEEFFAVLFTSKSKM